MPRSQRGYTKLEGVTGLFADHVKQKCDLVDREVACSISRLLDRKAGTKARSVLVETVSRQQKPKRFEALLEFVAPDDVSDMISSDL